ncbi:MAG: hypothetical protein WCT46_02990 [Candidatus Gracilibacteria bacterium]
MPENLPTLDSIENQPKKWIEKKENGQWGESPEAETLVVELEQDYKRIADASHKEQDVLFQEIISPIGSREIFSINNGESFDVGAEMAKKGLLEVLEIKSKETGGKGGALDDAFRAFPELRPLAYVYLYREFEKRGKAVDFLPIGSRVSLNNGSVTVEYPTDPGEPKDIITVDLFPWGTPLGQSSSTEPIDKPAAELPPAVETETNVAPTMPSGEEATEEAPESLQDKAWREIQNYVTDTSALYPRANAECISDGATSWAITFKNVDPEHPDSENRLLQFTYSIPLDQNPDARAYEDDISACFAAIGMARKQPDLTRTNVEASREETFSYEETGSKLIQAITEGNWERAENLYGKIETPSEQEQLAGVEAALNLGDAGLAMDRAMASLISIKKAAQLSPRQEQIVERLQKYMRMIHDYYGDIAIKVGKKVESITYADNSAKTSFEVAALDRANEILRRDGVFNGKLPEGDYLLSIRGEESDPKRLKVTGGGERSYVFGEVEASN